MLRSLLAGALALAAPLALAQGTIKIGVLGPMSQPQGQYHWFGAEMARDNINKAGGIDVGGRKVQILVSVETEPVTTDWIATKNDATSTSVSGVVLFWSSSWRETTAPATANMLE